MAYQNRGSVAHRLLFALAVLCAGARLHTGFTARYKCKTYRRFAIPPRRRSQIGEPGGAGARPMLVAKVSLDHLRLGPAGRVLRLSKSACRGCRKRYNRYCRNCRCHCWRRCHRRSCCTRSIRGRGKRAHYRWCACLRALRAREPPTLPEPTTSMARLSLLNMQSS